MNAVWLVEIAALWAGNSRIVAYSRMGLPLPPLNTYWIASRQRADNWHEALCIYRHRLESGGASQRLSVWIQVRRIIEEVLLSEVLTRVLAAIATQMESDGLDEDAGPIACNVAHSHAEARHRCLQIMVDGVGQPVSDAVQLNRMRFQLEEWTDMLLAQIGTQPGTLQHCHRASRVKEWAEDLASPSAGEFLGLESQLRMFGLRRWLAKLHSCADANPKWNAAIGQSVMAMLRPEWFDSLGCLKSLASHRVQAIVNETEGALSLLIQGAQEQQQLLNAHSNLERYRRSNSSDQIGD